MCHLTQINFTLAVMHAIIQLKLAKSYTNREVAEIVQCYFPKCKIRFVGDDNNTSNIFNNDYTIRTIGYAANRSLETGIVDLIKNV